MFAKEVERLDEIRVDDAEVEYRQRVQALWSDPQDGFSSKRGEAAVSGLDGFRSQVQTIGSDIEARLGTDRQRDLFLRRSTALSQDVNTRAGTYVQQETRRMDTANLKAMEVLDLNDVARPEMTNDTAAGVISEGVDRVTKFLSRNGVAADSAEMALARTETASNLRLAQIRALAESPVPQDVDRAQALLATDAVQQQLTPAALQQARRSVEQNTLVHQSQAKSQEIFAAGLTEAEALARARATTDGPLQDQVVSRIKVLYGERDGQMRDANEAASNRAMAAVFEGREIPAADRDWLAEHDPRVLLSLQSAREQKANGTPVRTDPATYYEIVQLLETDAGRDTFRNANLMEYANRLSTSDITQFMTTQSNLRGGTRTIGAGLTPTQIDTDMFNAANEAGLFGMRLVSPTAFRNNERARERWEQIRPAVQGAVNDRSKSEGRPLSAAEVRATIQQTVDGFVLEAAPGMFGAFRPDTLVQGGPVSIPRDGQIELTRFIEANGGASTPAKQQQLVALRARTDITDAEKNVEALRIAREP